jgi:hypothetical protein
MKIGRLLLLFCVAALTLMAGVLPAAAAASRSGGGVTVTSHFVVSDDANTRGDSAYLNDGATNAQPNAIVFVAFNDTPGGVCGCAIVTTPLGVWFDSSTKQWAVFTEDGSPIASTPSFNILAVQKASASVFVQRAAPSNTHGNHTLINSKLLNGNPHAGIEITQNYNPGGMAGTFNDHPVGVMYVPSKKKWAIFNEDKAAMTTGAAFNVMVGSSASNGGTAAVTRVTSMDHAMGTVVVNNSQSNNNPNNVMFATPVFNPGGTGGIYDAHPLEVAYPSPGTHIYRETVSNADFTKPPVGAAFNVLIFNS